MYVVQQNLWKANIVDGPSNIDRNYRLSADQMSCSGSSMNAMDLGRPSFGTVSFSVLFKKRDRSFFSHRVERSKNDRVLPECAFRLPPVGVEWRIR